MIINKIQGKNGGDSTSTAEITKSEGDAESITLASVPQAFVAATEITLLGEECPLRLVL